VSEQFINGTSAQCRLFSAIKLKAEERGQKKLQMVAVIKGSGESKKQSHCPLLTSSEMDFTFTTLASFGYSQKSNVCLSHRAQVLLEKLFHELDYPQISGIQLYSQSNVQQVVFYFKSSYIHLYSPYG